MLYSMVYSTPFFNIIENGRIEEHKEGILLRGHTEGHFQSQEGNYFQWELVSKAFLHFFFFIKSPFFYI